MQKGDTLLDFTSKKPETQTFKGSFLKQKSLVQLLINPTKKLNF